MHVRKEFGKNPHRRDKRTWTSDNVLNGTPALPLRDKDRQSEEIKQGAKPMKGNDGATLVRNNN